MMIVVLVIIVMILVMVIMLMSRCPLMTTVVNGWITAMVNRPVTAMETGRAITVMVTAAISRIVVIVSRI